MTQLDLLPGKSPIVTDTDVDWLRHQAREMLRRADEIETYKP